MKALPSLLQDSTTVTEADFFMEIITGYNTTKSSHNNKKLPQVVRPRKLLPNLLHQDFVDCQECGNSYKSLNSHIQAKHNLSWEQYRNKYPDKPMIGEDFLQDMQQFARKLGKSQEAVQARTKYWSNENNKQSKSKWMKEEMKKRIENDPTYVTRMTKEGVKAAKKRFKKVASLTKICLYCGKEFSPKTMISKDGYIKHMDAGERWKDKKLCSRECAFKYMKGKPKTEEHKLALALARSNRLPGGIIINNTVRYLYTCVVCGKVKYSYAWDNKLKKTCSLHCNGILAGRKKVEQFKDPEYRKAYANKYLKYRTGEYRKCQQCNKEYYMHPSEKDHNQQFCSRACWVLSKHIKQICITCGDKFDVRKCEIKKIKRCKKCINK